MHHPKMKIKREMKNQNARLNDQHKAIDSSEGILYHFCYLMSAHFGDRKRNCLRMFPLYMNASEQSMHWNRMCAKFHRNA